MSSGSVMPGPFSLPHVARQLAGIGPEIDQRRAGPGHAEVAAVQRMLGHEQAADMTARSTFDAGAAIRVARATPWALRHRQDQLRWLGQVGEHAVAGAAHPIHLRLTAR
jgi:hypothetical protein